MSKTMRLKLNAPLRGHPVGTVLTMRTYGYDIPEEKYWRDRLKDSATDNCVEILPKAKTTKAKSTTLAETKKKGE